MLSLLLNVSFFVMLSVVKLNAVRHYVVMLNAAILCLVILTAVMLSVMAIAKLLKISISNLTLQ